LQRSEPLHITDLLAEVAAAAPGERLSVGELLEALKDRAFGIVLLILALPCSVPFLYGIPQVASLPLLFVSAQIVMGRHRLWLPDKLRARSFSTRAFRQMIAKATPYLRVLEAVSRPRLVMLTRGRIERVLGIFLFIFAFWIFLPFPLTNAVPGMAVAIMAVGFIERDGLLMIGGIVLGSIWVAFLIALASGAWIVFDEALRRLFS